MTHFTLNSNLVRLHSGRKLYLVHNQLQVFKFQSGATALVETRGLILVSRNFKFQSGATAFQLEKPGRMIARPLNSNLVRLHFQLK